MQQFSPNKKSPWLVWVYPVNIHSAINAAPRLEVTKEMRNLGWKVNLIASGPNGKHVVDGVEVLCFTKPDIFFIRHLFFHLRVASYVLRHWQEIDVILFTQVSALWLLPLRLISIASKKRPLFVMDTRTVPMEATERLTFGKDLKRRFYFLMNDLANLTADGQTAITQRMADLLHIPRKRLWGTWPSGVNLEKFSSEIQNRCWPKADEPVRIIYIGMMAHARNLMTFCQTVLEANRHSMNFSFFLYGDGPQRLELEQIANQSQGKIQVFKPVRHDQIPALLAGAHIGVLPFPDEEKFRVSSPIKLFEYMGSGLPILATKIVCHTDVIGNGDYTFWAESSDLNGMIQALEKAWQQRQDLPYLGLQASIAARDWTYTASAKRLHNALQYGISLYWGSIEKVSTHSFRS